MRSILKIVCIGVGFLFLSVSATDAYAQYICKDRKKLRKTLHELEAFCGDSVVCKAKGYAGVTVEEAILECDKAGWTRSECAQNVECEGAFVSLCKSKGYAGVAVEEAIQECDKAGWTRSECARNVECEGAFVSLCKSKGYAGATLEDAINECDKAGWSRSSCSRETTCRRR